MLPCTKLDLSIWCRCFLSIFDFDSDSRPHFRPESVQRFINFNKIGYFDNKRSVYKDQWEFVLPCTKLDISIWCRCFPSIFDFDSDSRPHFRPESVQRFIYFNKIGYFVHKRSVYKDQWEFVLPCTKLDLSIWCRCFLSIFDFDSDSRPHFRPESVQRFINFNKIGYFDNKRSVYKDQWEFVLPCTKLDISIWCRCFPSIFDFDSDSRPHFWPESVQRFIYYNKIGYFVHKRSVYKDQWELVLACTKLDLSKWCRCYLSIFDFDSDSRPNYDPNQSRDSYILIKLDTLSIREVFIRTNGNSCYRALNWIYLYDADVFFQFSILIRILDLISDPNQSRDSYILIKLDTLTIREVFIRTNGNSCYRALNWIYLYDADVFLQFSILIRILDLISDPNQSRDSYILIKLDTLTIREVFIRTNGNSCYRALNWIYLYDADVFLQFSILIRILDLISDPNQSRDSYIIIKLDTLSIREVFIRTNGNSCYRALNWIYLYDADVFLQFSILIRILDLISDPNQSRDSFILIKLDTLSIREVFIRTNGN